MASIAALCESPQGGLPRRTLAFPALNGGAWRVTGHAGSPALTDDIQYS